MLLENLFGKKVESKSISFEEALFIIGNLKEKGVYPITYKFHLGNASPQVRKDSNYEYILNNLSTHLAPCQYKNNPQLERETNVDYISRDFPSKQIHNFYFKQIMNHLYKKRITVGKAKLKLRADKK